MAQAAVHCDLSGRDQDCASAETWTRDVHLRCLTTKSCALHLLRLLWLGLLLGLVLVLSVCVEDVDAAKKKVRYLRRHVIPVLARAHVFPEIESHRR